MANLVSPGVQVQVIDESFYTPAEPGTVPMIFVVTAQDKTSSSGDLIVEINIPKKNQPNYIGIHALTSIPAYITFPKKIELFDISSGKEVLLSSKVMPKPVANEIPEMKMYKMPLNKKNLDKVKLVITSNKKLPKGHPAEGEPAWLFVSEIIFLL